MNTSSDQLDQESLYNLLQKVEPSWKLNPIRPDPATDIFRKPVEPRRAHFRMDAPFGSIEATGGGSGSGGGQGSSFIPVTCTGVEDGVPRTAILAAYQAPQ